MTDISSARVLVRAEIYKYMGWDVYVRCKGAGLVVCSNIGKLSCVGERSFGYGFYVCPYIVIVCEV